jgi:hypothetical protein
MEYNFDVVPSLRTCADDNLPVNHIGPKVLRSATLKIDYYLIPIISMFCELSLSIHSLFITQSLPLYDLLSFLVRTLQSHF